ncbi:hypothetical protein CUZ56_01780 [Saezia sanguinis]|uniref:Uncharacterized protein n=1 Tax=Saezia sanguinis TaxID=1965230 RepID=A0A433SCP5_9BURK|nr:hypothetical protein [Saezia sanguinis]RUS66500.1 hypothetical protein CUZ56_01780 [Saezia sanguinis]
MNKTTTADNSHSTQQTGGPLRQPASTSPELMQQAADALYQIIRQSDLWLYQAQAIRDLAAVHEQYTDINQFVQLVGALAETLRQSIHEHPVLAQSISLAYRLQQTASQNTCPEHPLTP